MVASPIAGVASILPTLSMGDAVEAIGVARFARERRRGGAGVAAILKQGECAAIVADVDLIAGDAAPPCVVHSGPRHVERGRAGRRGQGQDAAGRRTGVDRICEDVSQHGCVDIEDDGGPGHRSACPWANRPWV